MLRKNILLLILIASFTPAIAQVDSIFVEWDTSTVQYEVSMDSIFENLDLSQMQTSILIDRGFIFNYPYRYQGTPDSTNKVNRFVYENLYRTIRWGYLETTGGPISFESVTSKVDSFINEGLMPLTHLSVNYEYWDSNAFKDDRINLVNNRYFVDGANNESPFIKDLLAIIAPGRNVMSDTSINFILPSTMVFLVSGLVSGFKT